MGQQIWATNSLGGFLSNDELSRQIRHVSQTLQRFRQFVDPEPASGAGRGDSVFFNKISNISTAGGTLIETDTIPKRNFSILQGTLAITEYGNSIPYTLKARTLSEVDLPEIVKTVLRNDMAKVLDSAAATQFIATDYVATVTNTATTTFGTAGTALATAGANLSDKNHRDIVDQMKKLNIPTFDGESYINISSTNNIRGVYDFFEAKAQNTTMQPLFRGEIGNYYKTRFVEETNFLSNTKGSNGLYGASVYFGADAVREGIAVPEELRIDIPKDFGRDQGVAWYALLGFQLVWDYTTDSDVRVFYVNSL